LPAELSRVSKNSFETAPRLEPQRDAKNLILIGLPLIDLQQMGRQRAPREHRCFL
jgi:hypothetical protein